MLLVLAASLTALVSYLACPSFKEALPEAPDLDDQGEEEDESPYADGSPMPTSEQQLVNKQADSEPVDEIQQPAADGEAQP